jgi:hypothetical protein
MKARRYERRVSPLERYSLVINAAYRYHVDGIVEGQGDVDPRLLQAAVDRAAAANPAIRVRLRGWLGFSRWVDSGIAPRVRALPKSDWDGNSERGAPYLDERLDARRGGPIADLLLVPCADGKTRIVFRTLHAAIDGRGCMHWVLEVCRAMRGEALQGSDSRTTDFDVQEQYRAQIPDEPPKPPSNCIAVLAPAAPDAPERQSVRFVWRRVLLDRNLSQLLPKTAVFLADWARRREAGEIGFTVPVDYRGFRIQEMGIGNLTGYLRLTVEQGATPRSVVQQLNQRVKAFADCRQFPGAKLLLWLPVWFMLRQLRPKIDAVLHEPGPGLPTGGVVSMGTIKPEHYDMPGFKAARLYGIPGAIGKLNVIFVNTPHDVSVSFAAPAAYNHQGQLDALADAYRQHFSTAVEAAA